MSEPKDDYGSSRRARHDDGLTKEIAEINQSGFPTNYRMRANAECRLDWYHRRNILDDRQYQAGLKLRQVFQNASLQPSVTSNYGDRIAGDVETARCLVLDARTQTMDLVEKLKPEEADVVRDVCEFDNWAQDRLKALKSGLDYLAGYWRLSI